MTLWMRATLTRLFKSKVTEQAVLNRILSRQGVSTFYYTLKDTHQVNEAIIDELKRLLESR